MTSMAVAPVSPSPLTPSPTPRDVSSSPPVTPNDTPADASGQTRVFVPELATAEDVPYTPVDAPPPGSLGASDDLLSEEFERLRLPEAASNAGTGAGEGGGGALDRDQARKALALEASCAHCGVQGVEASVPLKLCTRCKQAWYCGVECQKAAWKGHKTTCAPPPLPDVIWRRVNAAHLASDSAGVLMWEGRMEDLLGLWNSMPPDLNAPEGENDNACNTILQMFKGAHQLEACSASSVSTNNGTRSKGTAHMVAIVRLSKRRINLLGKMQRFRDQGEEMCQVANIPGNRQDALKYFQLARAVGAAHGFFSVESSACLGLGQLLVQNGPDEEGTDLIRNALVYPRP